MIPFLPHLDFLWFVACFERARRRSGAYQVELLLNDRRIAVRSVHS